jgi:CubicO group peptidase (beta-lactamase class C family)
MFGTVRAVLRFGEAVLLGLRGEGALAAPGLGRWLVDGRPGGSLAAGFDRKSEPSSAGTVCGPETVGHLGFTGTSLWIDLEAAVVVAVLSNRVHPTRNNARLRELRPALHDALFRRAARSRL